MQTVIHIPISTSYMAFPGLRESVLKKVLVNNSEKSAGRIKETVYKFYDIEMDDPEIKSRVTKYVLARQLGMYFMKKFTFLSLKRIGMEYGKDHATALHSFRQINAYLDTDKHFRTLFEEIQGRVITAIKK